MNKLVLCILCVLITCLIIKCQDKDLELELFKDEICSYNGKPKIINKKVSCECDDDFANDKEESIKFNGEIVQCSYEKKRRFIALFLSIFLPFGFNFLYLKHYVIFVFFFLICYVMLIGNCYMYAVFGGDDEKKLGLKYKIISLLITIMIIGWVLNIILVSTGVLNDGNDVPTVDDLYFFFK